jgi:hypothetical protein
MLEQPAALLYYRGLLAYPRALRLLKRWLSTVICLVA